jgi:ATP-dependent exoDNAse (exonuclease V) beta subunit
MTVESTFVPADQGERNAIHERVGENMCVEAGAGTGKTTVLVDRIVNIIRSGHAEARELAVITFTEKAAAELAGRVREKLEEAREHANDAAERARLEVAVRDLNRAHIETIHAFAASILRERPVEAGVDPGFAVLSDLPAQLAFEESYREWLAAQMAQDPPPEPLLEVLNLGADIADVREAAQALHSHRDVMPLAPMRADEADIDGMFRELDGACATLHAHREHADNPEDEAYLNLLNMLELCDALADLRPHEPSLRRAIAMAPSFSTKKGAQRNWRRAQDCRDVKAALDAAVAALTACSDRMKRAATARLLDWLQDFVNTYARQRKEAGKADFDDLLIWARDLVRGNAEVRGYFQQQLRCILVDEFQDTDPLQAELIVRLAEREGEHAADWRTARTRPGALFVVGDPKQSIYRFRRADIAMYDTVKEHVFGNVVTHIVQNFRSASPIIGWVNRRFSELIAPSPGLQPPYVELVPHPELETTAPAVEVIRCVIEGARVDPLRLAEAETIASSIADAVARGSWMLRTGTPATYRDVAVLIPSRAKLEIYEDALARAAVPYRHEGGRTFFLRQEVRELIAVLRAVDDPEDQVAAVAALRSAAFGVSDDDLMVHRAAGGGFTWAAGDAKGIVPDALRELGELRAMRHTLTLPDLIRAVIDRTRLVESAMLQPQGEQVAANLLKVIDQARTFTTASGGGLRGFVRWLKDNVARTADETDASISEESDDVVRIVTVHASKGLEFPVVVFANMMTNASDRTRIIAERGERRLQMKLGQAKHKFQTPGWDAALAAEAAHDDAERRRLLYVAATRARDRLVIPFVSGSETLDARKGVTCANDLLRVSGIESEPDLRGDARDAKLPEDAPLWRRPLEEADAAAMALVTEDREGWGVAHDALLAAAGTPLEVRTASALEEWEAPDPDPGAPWRGRATEFGTAVHAVLEHVDLARPDAVAPLATAATAEAGMPERAGEVVDVARRALASDVIARVRRSPRVLREAAFTVALPGAAGFAEGRMDLLFIEDGEIVIVDFKTDRVTAATIDKRAAHYRPQALVYAWAAARATGLPVREVVFLFARLGAEHAVPVDAALLEEAEVLLSRPLPALTPVDDAVTAER